MLKRNIINLKTAKPLTDNSQDAVECIDFGTHFFEESERSGCHNGPSTVLDTTMVYES